MDNLGNNNSGGGGSDKPIPLESGPTGAAAVKESPPSGTAPVSRAPLNLGGTGTAAPARSPVAASPAPASPVAHPVSPTPRVQAAPQIPVRKPVAVGPAPAGRITTCKTFFTKLHPGAIKFMDDQITAWLKENPGVVIKNTTAVTGEIVDKKTEPSILITIWY
jgi:hypothetical protein